MYTIEVLISNNLGSGMDSKEQKYCESIFQASIESCINQSGIYPIAGDWIYPLEIGDKNTGYGVLEITNRTINPNTKTIRYEIA